MSEALHGRLADALGEGYRIERELGGGGMSRVFLAEEVGLKRKVVVKVLPPEMAAGVNQDRFRREIELAAGLQHPHVVPVLTAGSRGDLLWYTMPFIEGESLRTRLARQGDLPVKETVHILREVADALAYAHRKGVVHRDIKPDNVMLSGRHALVTDFGVAKAVSESTGGNSLTSLGLALGTPSYMAPEQASAEPWVDHRADIYAFGATAYEMLAGRPPFSGMNAQAVLAAHVMQKPEPIETVRPTIPPALGALVMRCLEKRASDRWQEAEEIVPHLEALLTPSGGSVPTSASTGVSAFPSSQSSRVIGTFVVVAILVLGLVWWIVQALGLPDWVVFAAGALLLAGLPIMINASRAEQQGRLGRLGRLATVRGAVLGGVLAFLLLSVATGGFVLLRARGIGPFATLMTAGTLKDKDRILVADFENRTADSLLGPSVTEALRIDFTRSPVLRVLEPSEVDQALLRMQRAAGSAVTTETALHLAEREGVKAVVAGEIAALGAGFSLSARVVDVSGRTLLAERETAADAAGLIGAVDRLSRKLRAGIGESLRTVRGGEPLAEVTTGSLDALRAFTQALAGQRRGDNEAVLRHLQDAIRYDSSFASAWRSLGITYSNMGRSGTQIREAVTRAWQLRDRLPEVERLLVTAAWYGYSENDQEKLVDTYRQILSIRPDHRVTLNNLGIALSALNRDAEAEVYLRRAIELYPGHASSYQNLVAMLESQGRRAAADSFMALADREAPGSRVLMRTRTFSALARDDFAGAIVWADTMMTWGTESRGLAMEVRATALEHGGRFHRARGERLAAADLWRSLEGGGGSYLREVLWQAIIDADLTGNTEAARRLVDSALRLQPIESIGAADQPWLELAEFHYRTGRVEDGDRAFGRFDRAVSLGSTVAADYVAGLGKLAAGNPAEAVALLRKAQGALYCDQCGYVEIATAFTEMGQPDSAIAAFERFRQQGGWAEVDRGRHMGPVSYRLGELYEAKGDRAKAIESYSRFAELWKNADAAQQPRVAEAKRRIAQLTAER